MPDAGQFTLGLFDNTALGWTVQTPKAEPQNFDDIEDGQDGPVAPAKPDLRTAPNLYLDADRALARGWPARACDNLHAFRLSKELETTGRVPTPDEQAALLRFVGFGATELAQKGSPHRLLKTAR